MNRFLIVCLVVSGCTRGDDCITGEWRCAGDELQHCTQHGSNPIGSDPDGFIVWGINADRSWDAQAECGTNMCIDGTVTDRSFCAISATVEPRCAGVDNVCDGNVNVWCHDGYEIERVACTACDVSAGLCAGSLLSVCAPTTIVRTA